MKKLFTIFILFIVSTYTHAGILVLSDMPEGLRQGSFEILMKHQYGHYVASGPVVNEYDHRYDFSRSLAEANSIITDRATLNPSMSLSLRCANGASETHKLYSEQLKGPNTIVINPPQNCGVAPSAR